MPKSRRPAPHHVSLAVVFQVRDAALQVLMWRRGREPHLGRWALPGGSLEPGQTLEQSIREQLAAKVDVREVAHLEQLETRSDPERHPGEWQLATAYLGLIPAGQDPAIPEGTRWHAVDRLRGTAFDHGEFVRSGLARLRAKLSYTNVGFALAPPEFTLSELRELYAAALGHEVSATNLHRVLVRRGVLEPTGARREPGRSGGRPASLFRFRSTTLEVTDPFAVLRPPR
ncbi:MAG TPA: NUDIX domain-containing protein, partial [Gaiellaceae bacterium]|nr:NUDIX domain-containing protein [Gaiellaceae bacterium]